MSTSADSPQPSPELAPDTMKAIVQDRYGPPSVLELRAAPVPTVGARSVLVRVGAASVNPYDWHLMTGTPMVARMGNGWRRPKRAIRGVDLAGTVVAVGSDVTEFEPGDRVFGGGPGTFAEYVVADVGDVAPTPDALSDAEAGSIAVGAFTALQAVRDQAEVAPGERVLVNGSTGGVGIFTVQIAKLLGAEVTAVCSAPNVELAAGLGADHVVDYTSDDFLEHGPFDVIVDNVGNRPLRDCRRALTERGRYVMVGGPKRNRLLGPLARVVAMTASFLFSKRSGSFFIAAQNRADLDHLRDLLADGSLRTVVDRTYSLVDAAAAVEYVAQGHARGKVVLVP